jgi:hypothetical protein
MLTRDERFFVQGITPIEILVRQKGDAMFF